MQACLIQNPSKFPLLGGNFIVHLDDQNLSSTSLSNFLKSNSIDSYRLLHPNVRANPDITYNGDADMRSSRIDFVFITQALPRVLTSDKLTAGVFFNIDHNMLEISTMANFFSKTNSSFLDCKILENDVWVQNIVQAL